MGQLKLVLGEVRHQSRGGLLAFGAVVVAVWYASVAVRSLMTALNVAFEVKEDRPARWRYPPLYAPRHRARPDDCPYKRTDAGRHAGHERPLVAVGI